MKIVAYAPYGTFSPESGLIFLISHWLGSHGYLVRQLLCDGVFPTCERDSDIAWKRTLQSCLFCMKEQRSFAEWAKIESVALSHYISSSEGERIDRTVALCSLEQLLRFEHLGDQVYPLCVHSFRERFGVRTPIAGREDQELYARNLMRTALRAMNGLQKILVKERPTLAFVSDPKEVLGRTFYRVTERADVNIVVFEWNLEERSVKITHPGGERSMNCPFLVEAVAHLRPDPATWSKEVHQIIEDVIDFLDLPKEIESLKVAQ